jgi:hypothetical protein
MQQRLAQPGRTIHLRAIHQLARSVNSNAVVLCAPPSDAIKVF